MTVPKLKKLPAAEQGMGEASVLAAVKKPIGRSKLLQNTHITIIYEMIRCLDGFITRTLSRQHWRPTSQDFAIFLLTQLDKLYENDYGFESKKCFLEILDI